MSAPGSAASAGAGLPLAVGVHAPDGLSCRSAIAIVTLTPEAALSYLHAMETDAAASVADDEHPVRFFSYPDGDWDSQHVVRDLLENGTVLGFSADDPPGAPVPVTAMRACARPGGISFRAIELVDPGVAVATHVVPRDEFERAATRSRVGG